MADATRTRRAGARALRAALWIGGVGALLGAAAPRSCALYALEKGSEVVEGCFDPCECPLRLAGDLVGFLVLEPIDANPAAPVRHFDVHWVRWVYDLSLGNLGTLVTGHGTYEVGGEVALTQRLVLDLDVGDEPTTRYDSGVVAGGSDTERFPPIDLSISRNEQYCYDRVFTLRATPLVGTRSTSR